MKIKLEAFLDRIGKDFKENWDEIRDVQDWMIDEINRKHQSFPKFKKKVRFSFNSFKRNYDIYNNGDVDNLNSIPEVEKDSEYELNLIIDYFNSKFPSIFSYFFKKMFPFDPKKLIINDKSHQKNGFRYNNDAFFEYKYFISEEELSIIKGFKENIKIAEDISRITTNIINMIVVIFNKLVHGIVKNPSRSNSYLISMVSGTLKNNKDLKKEQKMFETLQDNPKYSDFIKNMESDIIESTKKPYVDESEQFIHFLISVQKIDNKLYEQYLRWELFHFVERLPTQPKDLIDKLYAESRKLYPYAQEKYSTIETDIDTTMYSLEYKCKILGQISPILDLFNFICSRVEDSKYDTLELVNEVLSTAAPFPVTEVDVEIITDIFQFINQNASLFSTFQSNNRANRVEQYQLFFFFSQYFCQNGFSEDRLEFSSVFLKDILLKEIKKNKIITDDIKNDEKYFEILSNFLFKGIMMIETKGFDSLFKYIFSENIYKFNTNFFNTFISSFNAYLLEYIEDKIEEKGGSPEISSYIIHIIFVILKFLIKRVFIKPTIEEASKNFLDQLSRYTPERLALRTLEINIFKIIPLSDNNWQDYFLSRNKNAVERLCNPYFKIPKDYFFTNERLLNINMLYERRPMELTKFLEEWLINSLVVPFYERISTLVTDVKKQFKEPKDGETYRENAVLLSNFLFEEISKKIIDVQEREDLNELLLQFVEYILY